LTCKANKYFSANQRNCLKDLILLQIFAERDQSSNMIYHLSWFSECIAWCKCQRIHFMFDLYL